jgi:hypothetical protein
VPCGRGAGVPWERSKAGVIGPFEVILGPVNQKTSNSVCGEEAQSGSSDVLAGRENLDCTYVRSDGPEFQMAVEAPR